MKKTYKEPMMKPIMLKLEGIIAQSPNSPDGEIEQLRGRNVFSNEDDY